MSLVTACSTGAGNMTLPIVTLAFLAKTGEKKLMMLTYHISASDDWYLQLLTSDQYTQLKFPQISL